MVTPRSLTDLLTERPASAESLMAGLPAGIAHFDRQGRLSACNPELERLLGKLPATADEIDLRPLGSSGEHGEPGSAGTPIARALAGQKVRSENYELNRGDGSTRWVRLSAGPAGDNGAGDDGAWLVLLDLGERKSLDVLRSQVLGVVAHDLRNPLSAMRMTLAMLVRKNDMPTERRVSLSERMLGTLGRMEALVSSLVEYAQVDAGGELVLKREAGDLGEVFDRVQRDMELLFPGRPIEVDRRGNLAGSWDTPRLERVLNNLLGNALKHGSDDKPVRVVLDGSGETNIQLVIHNHGTPISPELLPSVFEPFTIGTTDKQERRRNIGLGLFVVKHLVRAHGGEVAVRSTAEEGTTFTITLPRTEGARPRMPAEAGGDGGGPARAGRL